MASFSIHLVALWPSVSTKFSLVGSIGDRIAMLNHEPEFKMLASRYPQYIVLL